jgi:hypothetical protein
MLQQVEAHLKSTTNHCTTACYYFTQGFWLSPYVKHMTAGEKATVIETVMGLIEQKVIQPGGFVGKLFPLTQIAEAIAESTKDARGGKVFLDSR